MKNISIFIIAISLILGLTVISSAGKVTVNITDCSIISPEGNADNARILLSFELPNALADKQIDYATIDFGFSENLSESMIVNMQICPITQEWDPETITWSENWNSPGNYFTLQKASYAFVNDGDSGKRPVDITRIVNAWHAGNLANYGLVIFPENINAGRIQLARIPGEGNAIAIVKILYSEE